MGMDKSMPANTHHLNEDRKLLKVSKSFMYGPVAIYYFDNPR